MGVLINNILQDINMYIKMNDKSCGDLKKSTLRLGANHEVTIIVTGELIKCVFKELAK